jgi:cytochrome b pre-mRNA-processing protein 6
VNALYSLVEGRYGTMYQPKQSFMEPQSNPDYYKKLINDLEEAPDRTMWDAIKIRLSGFIKF